ncbi:protealysin propeptide [Pseudomonas duriflava]|uniref:Neutral metalloproteinase n=1 Tax=Pseudomonas duriflava TaxID=459528 RepID=A0A562QPP4_9PSED|nr:M4 family metallopeptidase [Pseudomonas duriflava]TWI58704.1 protealysin propeptide [Pseudomonas duriflava]
MPRLGSFNGFIPPYILSRIIDHGGEHQRSHALGTLSHVRSLLHNPGPPGVRQAPLGELERTDDERAQRSIYDAKQGMHLPGTLVRKEGQAAVGDIAVDEAYDYLGATFDFFWHVLGRNSIDNRGLPLVGTVHYGQQYQNAFWNGEQMVFGDGDGEIFNRFTIALDVIAHELVHGVTESEAGLVYVNQSGALNESVSDVFGVLVKQYSLKQTADQADWLIGEGLLTDKINGRALRSMAEPGTAYDDPLLGKDPQPGHMRDFIETREDNGGVHLNSGIPNRAFYLAATAIGGYAWEGVGRVWYDTLCDSRLTNDADFSAFARLTVLNASHRFGAEARETQAISDAWGGVGVYLT